MKRNFTVFLTSLLIVAFLAVAAHASFVTFTADSLYNAKNFELALKHYSNISVSNFQNASKPEVVSYLFGYESTKKLYVNKAVESAKVALYCYYMQALCNLHLKNYSGAVASASQALSCFNIEKTLTPKSMTSTGAPEVVKIMLPANLFAEYSAKIMALPIPANEILNAMAKTARERYAVETALSHTPQGPAYDQLMSKYMNLLAGEKTFADFAVTVISKDLDARIFTSFEMLVGFMKVYSPIDKSASSTVEVSDKIIKKMTAIAISLQGSDISAATQFNVTMQKLISVNAYIKGYLATTGGR